MVKNPNNAYPVYQMMKSALKFTPDQLFNAMAHLNAADRRLKTSPEKPQLILEKAVLNILMNVPSE